MNVTPKVQILVEQIIAELGMAARIPSSMRIDLDDAGMVQRVTQELVARRKAVDKREPIGAHLTR